MTDTSVKFFTSAMPSAPVLTSAAGTLITVLDACLVNGFGAVTASSAVIANGVCTISFGVSAHSFLPRAVALVSGITTSGYTSLNAEQKLTAITSNSISFATTLASATLGGTISVKLAPAGWAKAFSADHQAAYRSASVAATGCYLRVDDTTTYYAGVRGYESMTDVSTGTNAFPSAVQQSTCIWHKSGSSGATPWAVFADDRMVYFWVDSEQPGSSNGAFFAFGDFSAAKSGDAYACVLAAIINTRMETGTAYQPIVVPTNAGTTYAPRSYSAVGASLELSRQWIGGSNPSGCGGWAFPNGPDAGIYPVPAYLMEGSSVRGRFPGFYASPQNSQHGIAHQAVFSHVSALDRDLMYLWVSTTYGGVWMDLTGPWEH
jgi:hypothetical protein